TWFRASSTEVRNYVHRCTPREMTSDFLCEAIKAEQNEIRQYEDEDFESAEAEYDNTVVELDTFRQTHQSGIGKRTPDIKKNVEQAIAVLLFVLILEGCFNALLFKDAQSSGLLGGMLIAFGVSAVNVTCGVVVGFFGLRYLHHPDTPFKVLGSVVAGAFTLFGLFVNFFVAHFRDAVEHELLMRQEAGSLAGFSMFDIAPGAVISSMFPNIFGLDTLIALGLLFIGLVVFAVAVYEGYDRISDRYPGYGRVWRKERIAYEKRQAVGEGLRKDLAEYFSNCRHWLETQQARHTEARREIEKAMNDLEMKREQALAVASRCADQERGLKIAYRQAHRRMRNNLREKLGEQAAIPAYFDEIVTPDVPVFEYDEERALAGASIKTLTDNIAALAHARKWLEQNIQDVQREINSKKPRTSRSGDRRGTPEARDERRAG
ncbi:MAG: hypothetical protein AAGB25_02530, partial [Pseudomonadota bacterium]